MKHNKLHRIAIKKLYFIPKKINGASNLFPIGYEKQMKLVNNH